MLKKIESHYINQRYRDYVQPVNQDVFEVMNSRLPRGWTKKRILDFGCNVGGLLATAEKKIPHENYVGVDVNEQALATARERYPNARWVHYNGYNPTFNPDGDRNLSIDEGKFDVIIAYGVFTHCDFNEIVRKFNFFKSILQPKGVIAFSLWERPDFRRYQWFLKKAFKLDVSFRDVKFERSLYMVNRERLVIDQPDLDVSKCNWLETFYDRDHILQSLPGSKAAEGLYSHHTVFIAK